MDKQNQLTEMFEKRKKIISEASVEIFNFLKLPLEAVVDFFIETNEHYDGSVIEWQAVHFDTTEQMVFVKGYQTHKIGTVILPTGKTKVAVAITEETISHFNRPIQVGLPMDMAVTDDKQAVVDYLHKVENEYAAKMAIVMKHIVKAKDAEVEETEEAEFDLSSLSEDQRKVMVKSKKKGSKPN